MRNNRPLLIVCFFLAIKNKKGVLLLILFCLLLIINIKLNECAFSKVKNIYIVVRQQDTTHKKILPRASHVLCTRRLLYCCRNWI